MVIGIQALTFEDTVLYQNLLDAIRNYGIRTLLIYGDKGVGKTTLGLLISYSLWRDWEKVLYYLVFSPEELIRFQDELNKAFYDMRKRIKCLFFDDAGTWLNKYRYREEALVNFCRFYDLIRSICAVVIFTTPHPHNILKYVRDDVKYYIRIRRYDGEYRLAEIYSRFYTHPYPNTGDVRKGTRVLDKLIFNINDIPQWIRNRYIARRGMWVERAFKEFMQTEDTLKEYYTISEFCAVVRRSYYYIWSLVKEGRIRSVRINGKIYIPREEVEQYLQNIAMGGGK